MKRFCGRIVLLLLISVATATAVNAVRPSGLPWVVSHDAIYPPPTTQQVEADVTREQVLAAIDEGAVIIDARMEENYFNGHIPGARSFPAHSRFERAGEIFGMAAMDSLIIVYCGGAECEESREVYDMLTDSGFTNVKLYHGGWQDWMKDNTMPVEE